MKERLQFMFFKFQKKTLLLLLIHIVRFLEFLSKIVSYPKEISVLKSGFVTEFVTGLVTGLDLVLKQPTLIWIW